MTTNENTQITRLGLSLIAALVIIFATVKLSWHVHGAAAQLLGLVSALVAFLLVAIASQPLLEPPGRMTRIAIPSVQLLLPGWFAGYEFMHRSGALGEVWWQALGAMIFFGFAIGWFWNRHRSEDPSRGLTTSWRALFASFPIAIMGEVGDFWWRALSVRFVFTSLGFALAFAFARTTPRQVGAT